MIRSFQSVLWNEWLSIVVSRLYMLPLNRNHLAAGDCNLDFINITRRNLKIVHKPWSLPKRVFKNLKRIWESQMNANHPWLSVKHRAVSLKSSTLILMDLCKYPPQPSPPPNERILKEFLCVGSISRSYWSRLNSAISKLWRIAWKFAISIDFLQLRGASGPLDCGLYSPSANSCHNQIKWVNLWRRLSESSKSVKCEQPSCEHSRHFTFPEEGRQEECHT